MCNTGRRIMFGPYNMLSACIKFGNRRIVQNWRNLDQLPNRCVVLTSSLFTTSLQTHTYWQRLFLKPNSTIWAVHCQSFSTSHQNGPPNQQKLIVRMWTKLATTVRAFMAGTKLLYSDVKLMYELRSKKGSLVLSKLIPLEESSGRIESKFTRKEIQLLYKTSKDLKKMLPAVVVFFIPVLGYFVPLIVFMYPQTMLSQHFWSDKQKTEFSAAVDEASRQEFQALFTSLRKRGTKEQLEGLSEMRNQLLEGSEKIDESHGELFNVKKLPKEQKSLLYSGWNVMSIVMSPHNKLLNHLYYLHLSDWMIREEGGVEELTDQEILEACRERKLMIGSLETTEERKQLLQSWVNISTQFRECPVSLLAHIPLALQHTSNNH